MQLNQSDPDSKFEAILLVEYGILEVDIRTSALGIPNPSNDWSIYM